MPFSRVILKSRTNQLKTKKKFLGGKLHSQTKSMEPKTRDSQDVEIASKQISNINLNKRKPISFKL